MASPPIPKPTITYPQTFQNNHFLPSNHKSNLIFLPLKRPKHYHLKTPLTQPIKPTKTTHNPKTTTSDILHLLDTLNLPIHTEIYTSLIKECTLNPNSNQALELHNHIKHSGVDLTLPLINRLLIMHVACGHLHVARKLFDEIDVRRDCNSWVIIMIAYLGSSQFNEALRIFAEMMYSNNSIVELPLWVVVCILKACTCSRNFRLGKQVHGLLIKLGGVSDMSLNSALINFYGKLGDVDVANVVFDRLLRRNTVVWTAKMVTDCREGRFSEVLEGYKEMRRVGVRWNSFTLSCALRACARMEDGGVCGRQVHVNAIKLGLELDDFVQCGLIDMYGKCGIVDDAKGVFDMICDERNVACWNALLAGYRQNGLNVEALKLLYRMEAAGIAVLESLVNEVKIACGTTQMFRREE